MQIKQVVNETDWMDAIYEYIKLQLDGRFRLQFPNMEETIGDILETMDDHLVRSTEQTMLLGIMNAVAAHGSRLTLHSLTGCQNDECHEFQREFINLVWSARNETLQWLKSNGVIPGQSCN